MRALILSETDKAVDAPKARRPSPRHLRLLEKLPEVKGISESEATEVKRIGMKEIITAEEEKFLFGLYERIVRRKDQSTRQTHAEDRHIKREIETVILQDNQILIRIASRRVFLQLRREKNIEFSLTQDDVRTHAEMVLISRMETFDLDRDVRFRSYVQPKVKPTFEKEIKRSIRWEEQTIRVPEDHKADKTRVREFIEDALERSGKEPTNWEIADGLGLQEETVWGIRNQMTRKDLHKDRDNEREPTDVLDVAEEGRFMGPEEILEAKTDVKLIRKKLEIALDSLDPETFEIITRHFGLRGREKESLITIGETFGYTKQAASKKEQRAFEKFRKVLRGIANMDFEALGIFEELENARNNRKYEKIEELFDGKEFAPNEIVKKWDMLEETARELSISVYEFIGEIRRNRRINEEIVKLFDEEDLGPEEIADRLDIDEDRVYEVLERSGLVIKE